MSPLATSAVSEILIEMQDFEKYRVAKKHVGEKSVVLTSTPNKEKLENCREKKRLKAEEKQRKVEERQQKVQEKKEKQEQKKKLAEKKKKMIQNKKKAVQKKKTEEEKKAEVSQKRARSNLSRTTTRRKLRYKILNLFQWYVKVTHLIVLTYFLALQKMNR